MRSVTSCPSWSFSFDTTTVSVMAPPTNTWPAPTLILSPSQIKAVGEFGFDSRWIDGSRGGDAVFRRVCHCHLTTCKIQGSTTHKSFLTITWDAVSLLFNTDINNVAILKKALLNDHLPLHPLQMKESNQILKSCRQQIVLKSLFEQ